MTLTHFPQSPLNGADLVRRRRRRRKNIIVEVATITKYCLLEDATWQMTTTRQFQRRSHSAPHHNIQYEDRKTEPPNHPQNSKSKYYYYYCARPLIRPIDIEIHAANPLNHHQPPTNYAQLFRHDDTVAPCGSLRSIFNSSCPFESWDERFSLTDRGWARWFLIWTSSSSPQLYVGRYRRWYDRCV